jgi:hypothetical protein
MSIPRARREASGVKSEGVRSSVWGRYAAVTASRRATAGSR